MSLTILNHDTAFVCVCANKPLQPSLTFKAGNTKGGNITVPLTSCLTVCIEN
jgi:hypothetical protein